MKNIAVIGGGAAGLMAAVTAAGAAAGRAAVTVFERKDRVGKKLLATGNGRCNLSNSAAGPAHYHGANQGFVSGALGVLSPEHTLEVFQDMGVLCKVAYGGRVFPYCEQASAVLDAFRNELARLGVKVVTGADIGLVERKAGGFLLRAGDRAFHCDQVVVACGGAASPALGSNGGGFALLAGLGHTIHTPVPALVQLKTDTTHTKGLAGVKMDCVITALADSKQIDRAEGETLFTAYGLSGSGILDISRVLWRRAEGVTLSLDMMKDYDHRRLEEYLMERKKTLSHLACKQFLVGTVHKRAGMALLKRAGIAKLTMPVADLSRRDIENVASLMKGFTVALRGHNGWDNAQVTAGGASTAQFDPHTMESKIVPGLYAAGEVLDIFGDCGGFNLQWAWSSGHAAGLSAAAAALRNCHEITCTD